MAEKVAKKNPRGRRGLQTVGISLGKANYQLFAVAAVVLLVGYWALSQQPVDGFLTLSLAPTLLVIGYCVLIPLAIMWGSKKKSSADSE